MKINYILAADGTISEAISNPISEFLPVLDLPFKNLVEINIGIDKIVNGCYIKASEVEIERKKQLKIVEESEVKNKSSRAVYLDAYRKYQAAVNYGQFWRVAAIDNFIDRLCDKDWTAFDSIPPQIKYFTGETGLAESGLMKII